MVNENLNKVFDIKQESIPIVPAIPVTGELADVPKDVKNLDYEKKFNEDFDHARTNIRNIVQKAETALKEMLDIANQTNQPRAYEVACELIKTLVDTNEKLVQLHKNSKLQDNGPKKIENKITNNSVFIGKTSDLLKFVKENKNIIQNLNEPKEDK